MNLIYNVKDKPKFAQVLVFAFQQVLAILAATIAVPAIIGNGMSQSAALFGAGIGTLVYLLFTKFNSPVFLGSSFAFLGSMFAAFGGGVSMSLGYLGLVLGAVFAGLVYVILSLIVKFAGVKWINKLMPPVIIGPTVAIIGLSLAGNAVGDLMTGEVSTVVTNFALNLEGTIPTIDVVKETMVLTSPFVALICGLVTLIVTAVCATYGKKMVRLIPFVLGILAGYAVAAIFTVIGNAAGNDALKVITTGKRIIANKIYAIGNNDAFETIATIERAFADGNYAIGNGYTSKIIAITECIILDGRYSVARGRKRRNL